MGMKYSHISWVALFVVITSVIIFADRGVLDGYRLGQRLKQEEVAVSFLVKENDDLKKRIALLKTDLRYIEKVARDELGMVSDNDIIIYTGVNKKR